MTIENVAACRRKLTIEVPADDVAREWKGVVAEFQKSAQIPGFRPGRAPPAMLERRFEKEIGEEVQRKLIPQSFREAVAKEKLKVVSMPGIDGVKFAHNESLRFDATVEVWPDFALPNYKGLKAKGRRVELKPDEVENALKLLAEQDASFADVKDRPLAFGDYAVVSYSAVCEGKPMAEVSPGARPLAENKQFWLLMARDSFLPGFCEPLIGARVGDKRQVFVDFPEDFRIKELARRKATYFVDIGGIKEKQLPPFDDAFASRFKAAGMAELRQRIEGNLRKDREEETRRELRNELVDQLLKSVSFDPPQSLVQDEAQHAVADIVRQSQWRGVAEETLREKSKEIMDFAHQSAQDRVRSSLILLKIAEQEQLQVKEEDVHEQVDAAARRAGRPLKEFARKLEEEGRLDALKEQLLIRQALDLIASHAIVEPA